MIDPADIQSHIGDYLQILGQIDPGDVPSSKERHELALTIMRVHELHAGQHQALMHHHTETKR